MTDLKPEKPKRTIFAAISGVQKSLAERGISKDQKNASQGWKFRGIDDLLNALGVILAEQQVLILPDTLSTKMERTKSDKGKTMTHWIIENKYTMYDVHGDSISKKSVGEAFDMSDKGLAKANTNAYKYFVFQAFCVPLIGQEFGDADSVSHELQGWDANEPINKKQLAGLKKAIKEAKADEELFLKWCKAEALENLPQAAYEEAMQKLEEKKAKNGSGEVSAT